MLRILTSGLSEAQTFDHLRLILATLGDAAELGHHYTSALWLKAWAAWFPW